MNSSGLMSLDRESPLRNSLPDQNVFPLALLSTSIWFVAHLSPGVLSSLRHHVVTMPNFLQSPENISESNRFSSPATLVSLLWVTLATCFDILLLGGIETLSSTIIFYPSTNLECLARCIQKSRLDIPVLTEADV